MGAQPGLRPHQSVVGLGGVHGVEDDEGGEGDHQRLQDTREYYLNFINIAEGTLRPYFMVMRNIRPLTDNDEILQKIDEIQPKWFLSSVALYYTTCE